MTRRFAAIVLSVAMVALPAVAANDAAKKPAVKRSTAWSLDPMKGRYHQIHIKKLKMACDTCHATGLKDVLFLRGGKVAAGGPGPVDRAICLGCHQVPSKPAWYGAAP